jgi:hypothetical protein
MASEFVTGCVAWSPSKRADDAVAILESGGRLGIVCPGGLVEFLDLPPPFTRRFVVYFRTALYS